MSIIDNCKVLIQAVFTNSSRVGVRVGITVKEAVEFFVVNGTEPQIGVNVKIAKGVQQVKPVPYTAEATPLSDGSKPSPGLIKSNFTLTGVIQGALIVVVALALVEVLYENRNKQGGTFCNLKVPENFNEKNDFTRQFNVKYLLPVSTFTPKNYI